MTKQGTLAWLAKQFDGVRESGGDNKGTFVERFQRAVDGKARGEPWCAAFVQYCLSAVDELEGSKHLIPRTEATQPLWNTSPLHCRIDKPEVGAIVVWRKTSATGHCGIVVKIEADTVVTVEGNTGAGDQREGDGVAVKRRPKGQIPGFTLLGYLKPWGE